MTDGSRYRPQDADTLDLLSENYPGVGELAADLAATYNPRNQVQAYYGYLRDMLRDELFDASGGRA